MIIEFKLKNLSGHAKEGKIGNVHIKVGDRVEKNDVLFEIETNKGNVPVKSDIAGEIAKINVESGIEVKIGDVLATIDADVVVNEDEKNEPIEFKLQSLSGQAKEGKVGNIHVNVGDKVEKNDVLFEIETNKGNVPVKSDIAGEIAKINVESGVVVKIGDVLAIIEGKQTGKADSNVNNKSNVDKKNTNSSYSYLAGLMKPVKKELESDIVIIGGGPGGYVAAIQAAKMGANVIVVEMDKVGGTCLNRGCIPTKSLVRSAEVFKEIKEAENFGIAVENATISMKKVIERKNNIVKQLVQGIEYLLDKNNIKVIKGKAEIQDKETVLIKDSKQETIVKSKNIIIATGSETAMIPIPGVNSKNVLTSTQALELEELPAKIVIIGGGVIGMEFAFIYANMGVEVAVVEFMDDVCFTLDDDTIELIAEIAKDAGIKIHTSSKVESIMDTEDGQSIVSFVNNGEAKYIAAEKVLLSVGRVPFCEGLGLENVGIELNERGKGIKVNDKMQTNVEGIYAIGDVTGKIQLAHVASHQGIVAVENIMGTEMEMDYTSVPSAIFTDPEIAMVGICEREAAKKGIEVTVGKFPFSANGKALTFGESRGFVKIIKEKSTGKIIGGQIIGPHATDLIAEITLAVKNQLTEKQLIETIHAHPTTAESVHEAALATTESGALHFA